MFLFLSVAAVCACTGEIESTSSGAGTSTSAVDAACAGASAEGQACDDGLFCTVNDHCHAGACVGEQRPCEGVVGYCSLATCDEDQDACLAAPREDADGDACVDRCDTPRLHGFYQKGWTQGHDTVEKAWDRQGEACDRAETFIDAVSRRIEEAQRTFDPDVDCEEDQACRQAGMLDGSYAALESIQDRCDRICFLDGDLVGVMTAIAYCETAITSGPNAVAEWMRGPVNLCGLSYETACDGAFIGTSIDYVNPTGACEPFTTGTSEGVWDRTRARVCDYRNRP